jgi:hypothetical protein
MIVDLVNEKCLRNAADIKKPNLKKLGYVTPAQVVSPAFPAHWGVSV